MAVIWRSSLARSGSAGSGGLSQRMGSPTIPVRFNPAGGALSGAGGALGHHRRLRAALCADRVPELFPPLRLFGSYALMKSALKRFS